MHDPVDVHPQEAVVQEVSEPVGPDAMASVESVSVTAGPATSSPLAVTILAGVVGIMIGMVIAPLSERISRRSNGKDH
jgi:hypothetical protein